MRENNQFHQALKVVRNYFFLETLLGIAVLDHLLNAALYFRYTFVYHMALALLFAAAGYLVIRRRQRLMSRFALGDAASDSADEACFDKYGRRTINWALLAIAMVLGYLATFISIRINSKTSELIETFFSSLFGLEVVALFLIRNLRVLKWLLRNRDYANKPVLYAIYKKLLMGGAIYCAVAILLYWIFEYVFVLDIYPFLTGCFYLYIVVCNFTAINRFVYQRKRHNKIVVAVVLSVGLLSGGYAFLSRDIWLTQPYINSVPNLYEGNARIAYDDTTGIYTITRGPGDFKILQLTDIHLGGSVLSYGKDIQALEAVYELIDRTRPDFVIVTGDLVFPVGYASFSFNNTAPVQQFAALMRNLGVPWAFTYGNHDTESYAASSAQDLNELYKKLSWKTSKTLLYPYIQPDITGRNNQVIELRNQDHSVNHLLFLLDSNAYTESGFNKYDYIHEDQVAWYEEQILRVEREEGHMVPSLVFFHIPLQEYREAYQLYLDGSDQVTCYFGSNEESGYGEVCCSDYPSQLFDKAKELGSTTGFFCGHDHYNNISLEYQGIRLTYGMSIDYLAMPGIARDTKQRGATLITIHEDGSSDIEQIPLA